MKKLSFSLVACLVVGIGCALLFTECKDKSNFTKDEVDNCVETSEDGASMYISEANFKELSEKYAADQGDDGDTTGFYNALVEMLSDYGKLPDIQQPYVQPAKPLSVAIYLDNTSSMAGYINAAGPGGNAVANIINALSTKYNGMPIDAYYINKDNMLQASRPSDLTADLMNNKMSFKDAYTMYAFLDTIATKTKADTVYDRINFFVTDAIPSFPSPDIKKDREKNRAQAADLESRIAAAAGKLAGTGNGVSIYQFDGNFNGTYYDYRNNVDQNGRPKKTVKIDNQMRPFYVIAIGRASALQELANLADQGEVANFNPKTSIHALTPYKQPVVFVPQAKEEDGVFEMEEDFTSPILININVESVPQYVLNPADLDANSTVELPFTISINGTDQTNDLRSHGALKLDKGILTINQQKIVDDMETIQLRFKNQIAPSFLALSTDDDTDLALLNGKTFNLDRVANGLIKGIYNNASDVWLGPAFEFTIKND